MTRLGLVYCRSEIRLRVWSKNTNGPFHPQTHDLGNDAPPFYRGGWMETGWYSMLTGRGLCNRGRSLLVEGDREATGFRSYAACR